MDQATDKDVLPNAESLCKTMIVDYQEGEKLSINYPNRFRYYEDLNTNPLDKVETIYRYLGMSVDKSKYSIVKSIPVFDSSKDKVQTEREKNTAYW